MKSLFKTLVALGVALSLGACASLDFRTPASTAASLAVLADASVVVVCDLSALAGVGNSVLGAASAAGAKINGKVITGSNVAYASSSAACTGLGGLIVATGVKAPVGQVVVTAGSAS